MIAASEPLEFIPRGRQTATEHPERANVRKPVQFSAENLLLNRLKNVNLSDSSSPAEFWCVEDVGRDFTKLDECIQTTTQVDNEISKRDDEHELYVKGCVAVWTRGAYVTSEPRNMPTTCFTAQSHIRFAFFCSSSFFKSPNPDKREESLRKTILDLDSKTREETIKYGICLIDSETLRVYSPCGEDYRTSFPFPVSNVMQTKYGLLMEKNASTASVDDMHSIAMPRLYSLSHPLNDICPTLFRGLNGHTSFITEQRITVAFTIMECNLVMVHDGKIGKHVLCKLRKATQDEKQKVGALTDNDIFASDLNMSNTELHMTTGSIRFDGSNLSFKQKNSSIRNRSSLDASSLHTSKLFNMTPNAHSFRSKLGASFDKSQMQSPYDRLQSSSDVHNTFLDEEPKIGFARPSKPIIPELCLESIWIESIGTRDFPDVASRGFLHCDFIGQKFMCYLLKKTGILMMYRLEKSNSPDIPTVGKSSSIPAKDAVCISALKVIAILGPCGSLTLYSGPVLIGKVDISSPRQPSMGPGSSTSSTTYPRRSSLLPTATESSFDDEVHLLSPVYPLQSNYNLRSGNSHSQCLNLRDVCGSRITLQYGNDTMYRITLPPLSECPLVTKCLVALRTILKRDLAISIITKWYSIRNTRGSQDMSYESEWLTFQNYLLNAMGRTFISTKPFSSAPNIAGPSRLSTGDSKKRRKTEDQIGSDYDFQYLMAVLNKTNSDSRKCGKESKSRRRIDMNSTLAQYIPVIFFSFHLLYEEMKFDETLKSQRTLLAEFLNQLALDLKLDSYCLHYFLDCPDLVYMYGSGSIAELDRNALYDQFYLKLKIPSIYGALNDLFSESEHTPYPYIPNVNPISKQMIELVALVTREGQIDGTYNFNSLKSKDQPMDENPTKLNPCEIRTKSLELLLTMNMTRKEMSRFPPAIQFIIAEILEDCRRDVPPVTDNRAFGLIHRPELLANTLYDPAKEISSKSHTSFKIENSLTLRGQTASESAANAAANSDGMAHIYTKLIRLRFPKDLRIEDVRQMLASSTPAVVDIVQRLGVSDHDFIEERERQLLAICTRTMSLPVGRGMLTLQTFTPAATESFDIPKLCLTGKEKEKGSIIEMTTIEVPANMNTWPLFHNGVAAGLQLTSESKHIDSAWIVYNKPKTQNEGTTEHAGFLMALGLTGHLKILSSISLYDYLVKCDEMTNLGILIGISAAHRGTMDNATTKLLSIHIDALLPRTALELDISQNVQIAAIMGIGLLYQGTAKRHIAEVLVQGIGRPPGPEMDNCVERESYALTAGLALGLVTLGRGETAPGLTDLKLPDILHRYMTGGRRDALAGNQRFQSFQVREGETVNVDVTAPGATFALGLMFIRTGNKSVASWMDPPDTHAVLDDVRPDLLLLRVVARGLIMWDDIKPTTEWLRSQFPKWLQIDLQKVPITIDESVDDHESFAQAYCNITAGAAFCLGLRYAGTQNEEASAILDQIYKLFLNSNTVHLTECAGKPTVESCLMIVLLASSMVTAGSGDLKVLRRCRMLRNRLGPGYSHVTYGSHMAVHMAIGFQFLGAGRFTLSQSPEAIAALICALFPKFPIHSNDNRYHLQAFRHLYVLAVEPRIILPRDIDTGKLCPCNITYVTLDGKTVSKMAPCMLPELNELSEVRFDDPNYWVIQFKHGMNWEDFERIIKKCNCVDIKQKAGCVSHIDDPTNLRSTFAYTLSTERYVCWRTHPLNLLAFTNNSKVQSFINKFLTSEDELSEDSKFLQLFMLQFYHCLTKDTMHALYIYVDLLMSHFRMMTSPESFDVWQLKLIQTIVKYRPSNKILSAEHLNALVKRVETLIESKIFEHAGNLQHFLQTQTIAFLAEIEDREKLKNIAALIQFLDIPINIINQINLGENQLQMVYFRLIMEMKRLKLNTDMILIVTKILNST